MWVAGICICGASAGTRTAMHAGWVRDGKIFGQATQCGAKAHELNQLKIAKHVDVLKLFASIVLRPVSPEQLLHYDVTTHSCETLAHAFVIW